MKLHSLPCSACVRHLGARTLSEMIGIEREFHFAPMLVFLSWKIVARHTAAHYGVSGCGEGVFDGSLVFTRMAHQLDGIVDRMSVLVHGHRDHRDHARCRRVQATYVPAPLYLCHQVKLLFIRQRFWRGRFRERNETAPTTFFGFNIGLDIPRSALHAILLHQVSSITRNLLIRRYVFIFGWVFSMISSTSEILDPKIFT